MNFEKHIEKYGFCVIDIDASNLVDPPKPIATKYNVVVMCHGGEATLEANMHELTIKKGECLSLINVLFMRTVKMNPDFKARVLLCSRSFALDTTMGIPSEYIEGVFVNPVLAVDNDDEWKLLGNYFEILKLLQSNPLEIKHQEVAGAAFRSVIIVLAQIQMRRSGGRVAIHYSQSDVYFRNFIDLIDEHVEREHEVAFYAEKLHITAKYLSEISKQKCGHKAKEVISTFLIARLKKDILLSGKSVKVIAYEYGFADQSSMGKFFNKMTGQSPSDFKRENL